jgi:hypothetical protein
MPANTVKVDRSTRWGNPFDVREYGHDLALRLFEDTLRGCFSRANVADVDAPTAEMIYEAHCRWVRHIGGHPVERARTELRGRHLACWCANDQPCHAEILLRVANAR